MELVIFNMAQGRYALRAEVVSKVLDVLPVTPLPYAPDDVEGLVNVAGAVLLKVDLGLRLGLPMRSVHPQGNLLVVMTGMETVAVQVDRVFNKVTQDESAIQYYERTTGSEMVAGEFEHGGEMILLLNEGKTGLKKFVSNRTKRTFEAFLVADKAKGWWFEFPPRKPRAAKGAPAEKK